MKMRLFFLLKRTIIRCCYLRKVRKFKTCVEGSGPVVALVDRLLVCSPSTWDLMKDWADCNCSVSIAFSCSNRCSLASSETSDWPELGRGNAVSFRCINTHKLTATAIPVSLLYREGD